MNITGKEFFAQTKKLPVEKIMEIDLEKNNPGTDVTTEQMMAMTSKMLDQGWKIKRFNNTLFFTQDQGPNVLFHTMTAEKPDALERSAMAFYLYELHRGKKKAYTYFDNPTIIRLFKRMEGAETVVKSDKPNLGKYKALVDLPAAAQFYQSLTGER
jgi:hypothetical protein